MLTPGGRFLDIEDAAVSEQRGRSPPWSCASSHRGCAGIEGSHTRSIGGAVAMAITMGIGALVGQSIG